MSVLTENKLSPQEEISILKNTKNAVILAHYYQEPEIQEIADFVGDSLELAKKAATTNADIIVFAGVHFMAETAKILNPSKKVLLPDLNAGCSLAESCPPEAFQQLKDKYPDHVVVTYINCSAEIKAMSDVVCTSSNAERVINSIPLDKPIIFAPDKNLGRYLIEKTGRKMLLWDGACIVHEAFSIDKLLELYAKYPSAKIIAHPESEEHILKIANYIGSTSGMLNFVKSSDQDTFIVATEAGILHQMQMDVPDKTLIPAPAKEDNSCACSECAFMKMNTLQKLYNCLKDESPEIVLAESLMKAAHRPIKRMMEL
ncbi:quinolinate synthetase [Salegentibacter agarivorans]|mgnify:FL=1|jgi:quinolinate synthase|uniref:Quinolinate synthase n=1 Tax=Salegentibacter agarivorans TaxID=345907 RepID=A0A1I2NJN8_9FLAO|nr:MULTISPECIES: quinolinate synthase NadA [Salegentibacter]MBO2544919.1 quinolinate synthase NadA [Salegentibacter sp. BDJ18]SFG01511.1 quinolinate synthetase [Salegentibacter agarivorans]